MLRTCSGRQTVAFRVLGVVLFASLHMEQVEPAAKTGVEAANDAARVTTEVARNDEMKRDMGNLLDLFAR